MRAVVQRVSFARVVVDSEVVGEIERGLCVLVGVGNEDAEADAAQLASKVAALRIFEDAEQKMNLSVIEVGGSILAISQFTLYGDVRRGNRPSFTGAMEPVQAAALFEHFCSKLLEKGLEVQKGRFRAHMQVALANEGPVTILLDTQRAF